jgi:hexosaminidase
VSSLGKDPVGWQEIVRTPLPPGTLVQYWDVRAPQQARAAVESGARLVMSPADHVYLDMRYDQAWPIGTDWAGLVGVEDSYSWDPANLVDGVTDADVAGVEAPLWTETVADFHMAETMLFPRLSAVAEVAWTPRHARRWAEFRVRLGAQAPLWDRLGIAYHRSPEIPWTVS